MRTLIAISFVIALTDTGCNATSISSQSTRFRLSTPAPIMEVSVRDADFRVVKVLAPDELVAFRQHWENKQEVKGILFKIGPQHYKLDVERQDTGARWIYQTTGYVQVLSKFGKPPVYKLQDPETFNRLIGATK